MKYRTLTFIIGIMLAGCHGRHSGAEHAVEAADSIPQSTKTVSLIDSVHDAGLKKLSAQDSVDLLDVRHVGSAQYLTEQILYLDHKVSTYFKHWSGTNWLVPGGQVSIANDTFPHIINTYPELNGAYFNVLRYNGRIVFFEASDGGSFPHVINDTGVWQWGEMQWSGSRYVSSSAGTDGIITYKFDNSGNNLLQIKKLGGKNELQLWKTISGNYTRYDFMVPAQKGQSLSTLFARNNMGAGSDIDFNSDKINYDSLFNSK